MNSEISFFDNCFWFFDFLGNVNEDFAFEYGDGTEAYDGCGVTFQNEFWYFGGIPNGQQVNLFKYVRD